MIRLGYNGDRQTQLSQVPRNILIAGVDVPTYRGKRFIEVNSTATVIENVSILDAYSPVGQDSQAINILNTPGDIIIRDCHLQAASNNIMIGGDIPWILGNHIKMVLIEDCILDKPLSWKAAGTPKVKNNFEAKDGWDVTLRRVNCINNWVSGQVGYAYVLTPSRGSLRNIVIENCTAENVGGIFNITGTDAALMFPERTQVKVFGGSFTTNKPEMGGSGWFALLQRGPEYFECYDANIDVDAQVLVVGDSGVIERIVMKRNLFGLNKYGISLNGHHAQLEHPLINNVVNELIIEENTISGATAKFKLNFPNNAYI